MRRILITLDSSGGSLDAVEGAAVMAAQLDAELVQAFVQQAVDRAREVLATQD